MGRMKQNMKSKVFILTALAAASFMFFSCEDGNRVAKDMAAFDRYYIPALYYTGQDEKEISVKKIMRLKAAWSDFKNKYSDSEKMGWKREFVKINRYIEKADRAAAAGNDMARAHEALEEVRFLLLEARRKNKIDYIGDYLTDFHSGMEAVVSIVKNKSPKELKEENLKTINEISAGMLSIMRRVEKREIDKNVFKFSGGEKERLKEHAVALRKKLTLLNTACGAGDKKRVKEISVEIKPVFIDMFLMFGDRG